MLDEQHKKFIDEYLHSYSIEGASIKAGYDRQNALQIGMDLLTNPEIQEAIKERESALSKMSDTLKMTKERLLRTMYFQYEEASKRGRVTDAMNILEKIARWSGLNPDEIQVDPVTLIINNLDEGSL